MGRKKTWDEDMQARFVGGTFARIAALLAEGEDRTDFVRAAVEKELIRREKASPDPDNDRPGIPRHPPQAVSLAP